MDIDDYRDIQHNEEVKKNYDEHKESEYYENIR